jgi:hypothetical protein
VAIRDRKPGWLDDMGFDIKTGTQAENCPGVLRDIGLKKRNPH